MPIRSFGRSVTLLRASVVVALVILADRATKVLVMSSFQPGESVPIVPGLFSLTYVRNPGAAFGLLANSPLREPILVFFAVAAVAGLTWLLVQTPVEQAWERIAASVIIGGALGNLYDRLAYGSVVDFLDVYVGEWHWPAFNLADSCITVGVAILLIASFLRPAEGSPPSSGQEKLDGDVRAAA